MLGSAASKAEVAEVVEADPRRLEHHVVDAEPASGSDEILGGLAVAVAVADGESCRQAVLAWESPNALDSAGHVMVLHLMHPVPADGLKEGLLEEGRCNRGLADGGAVSTWPWQVVFRRGPGAGPDIVARRTPRCG